MRRIAPLVADLFVRHGLTVDHGTEGDSSVVLAVRDGPALLLVGGDLGGAPLDNATLAPFLAACLAAEAPGLFLHAGPVTAAASLTAGDRVRLWSLDAVAHHLGRSELAAAFGDPLPAVPRPQLLRAPAPTFSPVDDLAMEAEPAAASTPVSEPEDMVIDLPPSAAADVAELTEETQAVFEPFIELADETPVLHLEEADGTLAEVEPAPAAATEAPDVIALDTVAPPEVVPALDVLAEPVFEVPAVNELMPPAFREAARPTLEPVEIGLELPPAFAAPEGNLLRAPDGSQGLLPPRVTLAEAKALVADRLFSVEEAELILQPVHLFDYQVDLLRPGKITSQPATGRLQVNGTDRRVTATDAGKCDPRLAHRVFADEGLTVMDKVLRVSPERAEQLATAWATAEHAKTIQVTTDRADDSYALTEAKSVGPTSNQVSLTPLGLWHRPFWRLWGDNGHADIDAVEGTILDAEIKTPNPDFLVVE